MEQEIEEKGLIQESNVGELEKIIEKGKRIINVSYKKEKIFFRKQNL